MQKRLIKISILLSVFILLYACSEATEEQAGESTTKDEKDELVLAIGGEPEDGFDPTTGWGRYGSPLFQSTLLIYDEAFELQTDLANDYDISDDGLEYTIELKEDIKFSDGLPLTASDVVFTYETAQTSGSVLDLNNIEEIEEVDERTVRFKLNKPESTFIHLLTTLGIVPEHAYDDNYNQQPIGSGPYQLVQWDKGQQLIVEENPHYYGEQPSFKKLTFLFLAEDAAFAAVQSGEVDIASIPSIFAQEEVDGMKLVELDSVDNRGVILPYVEEEGETTEEGYPIGNDITADKAIRQAMNIAVDRETLVEGVLHGFGTPAYSVVDQLPWWNPDTVMEDARVEEAQEMLDEAGWEVNEDGVREKDGKEARLTLSYPADDQIRQALSLAFADMMESIDIYVETEGKSWNELERYMYSEPVMMGWGSHDPLEMYNIYSSHTRGEGYYNTNYYSNPTVDDYMDKAMRATSQEEANEWWEKAQWDGTTGLSARGDAPWVWLVNLKHLYFIHEDLDIGKQKVQPHGHGWPITENIEQWHWNEEKEG